MPYKYVSYVCCIEELKSIACVFRTVKSIVNHCYMTKYVTSLFTLVSVQIAQIVLHNFMRFIFLVSVSLGYLFAYESGPSGFIVSVHVVVTE